MFLRDKYPERIIHSNYHIMNYEFQRPEYLQLFGLNYSFILNQYPNHSYILYKLCNITNTEPFHFIGYYINNKDDINEIGGFVLYESINLKDYPSIITSNLNNRLEELQQSYLNKWTDLVLNRNTDKFVFFYSFILLLFYRNGFLKEVIKSLYMQLLKFLKYILQYKVNYF